MNAQFGPSRLTTTPAALMALLYRSNAAITRHAFEASGAPAAFAAHNRTAGLTGYLHLEDGVFYQYLEGPGEALATLWAAIQTDPRHTDVQEVTRGPVTARRFERWAMGYDMSEARSLFDWAARSGLSLKGPKYPRVVTAFMEYASASTRIPC